MTHSLPAPLPTSLLTRRAFTACAAGALLAACDVGARGKFHSLDVTGAKYAQDFELADMHGRVRRMADFRGKVVALFFGYTQCPDVCPTTLGEMVLVKQALGADGDRLQPLFVTVDPQRDTPEILRVYMAAFDPSFLALVPTPEQLRTQIAPQFKVYYNKVEGPTPTSYTLDHTAGLLIFDPQGRVRLHSNYGAAREGIVADIQTLLREGSTQ